MYWILSSFLFTVFFVEKGSTRLTPDFIHPCKLDDAKCMTQSTAEAVPFFVKGLPGLGVPPLDPFHVEKIAIPLPAGVKATISSGDMTGLRKTIIDKVDYNMKTRKFSMEFHGNVTLKGAYTAVGRILAYSIDGDGDAKIKLTNFKVKITFNTAIVTDDNGVEHFSAKSYRYTFDYGDKVTFNLTNLFKGNQELGNSVMQLMNENWRILAQEFGKPIMDYTMELCVRTIEKFFLAVPYEELIEGPFTAHD